MLLGLWTSILGPLLRRSGGLEVTSLRTGPRVEVVPISKLANHFTKLFNGYTCAKIVPPQTKVLSLCFLLGGRYFANQKGGTYLAKNRLPGLCWSDSAVNMDMPSPMPFPSPQNRLSGTVSQANLRSFLFLPGGWSEWRKVRVRIPRVKETKGYVKCWYKDVSFVWTSPSSRRCCCKNMGGKRRGAKSLKDVWYLFSNIQTICKSLFLI